MYRSFTASTKFGVYMEPYITNDILGKLGVHSIFVLYTACIRPCISHHCGRGSIPVMAVSGKAGSCLPLVGSLQYRTLANYMYWFPLPFQLPVVI